MYSMIREDWVSMHEAAERTGGEITVGYTGMPSGFDDEQLQINIDALRRGVIGWGGYGALTLAAYAGDADSYQVGVGGSSADGTAFGAGSVTVSKARSSEISPASDKYLNYHDIRNGSLGIQWNINALNSRIPTHEQFDPRTRAGQLDREIRKAAIKGVVRHNTIDVLYDRPKSLSVLNAGLDAWFIYSTTNSLVDDGYSGLVVHLALRVMFTQTFLRSVEAMVTDTNYRDCVNDLLFFTTRPTRAIAASSVLGTNKLVRATPTKKSIGS